MRARINLNYVIAVEEFEDGKMCVVTPVRDYCTAKDRVRFERDPVGAIALVVET